LKVGLNATCLNARPSGAKQRFVGIYSELLKLLPDAEFVIFEPIDCRVSEWFDGAPNVSARQTPIPSEGRAQKLMSGFRYWGDALAREKFDIFEGFNMPLVKSPTGRTLLTIHDIRGINPEYGVLSRTVFKTLLGRSINSADHVVTVSDAMKAEILKLFPGVPISVIYNGLDTRGFDSVAASDMLAVHQKFSLPEKFVLAVGHFEVRKNYLCLIDAVAMLRDRGHSCSLLIIGNDSGEGKAIEARVAALNLSGSVQILSGLSDLEVRCAYKLCSLFVFPSSYEGFGVPILEAMAAGCSMVLSDIPVFREITENRGVYFPHDDVEAIASAMEKVLTSNNERERQIRYGYERVEAFNFKSLAEQLVSLYKILLNG
jgi:glycosyltransferase involved in cell wall biosynthesis